jgi:hypothetical protein
MARLTSSTPKSNKSSQKTARASKGTPTKSPRTLNTERSKYFEPPTDDDEDSSFDEQPDLTESESLPTVTDDEEPPKKKSKPTPRATPKKAASKGRKSNGGKSDEEPWETFVPKEDTPDAGGISYNNTTIHPNTLHFLKGTIVPDDVDHRFGRE